VAGILANSSSRTMLSGETAADNSLSGWITNEQVTLSVTPTGTDYAWGDLAKPSASTVRSALSASTGASVTFVPDVEGDYVVTVVVDSTTTYVLTMTVVAVGTVMIASVIRLLPLADAQVTTPATGLALYYSTDQSAPAVKDSAGNISTIDLTAVP